MSKLSLHFLRVPDIRPWVVAVGVMIAATVFEYAGLTGWLRNVIQFVAQPMRQATVASVQTVRRPFEFLRVSTLKYSYILDLELKYSAAESQLSELAQLRQENQELKKLLENSASAATLSTTLQTQPRRVVPVISYAQPTIGMGAAEGLSGGEVVRVSGVFVGKISQVAEHQSQLKLLHTVSISDPVLGKVRQENVQNTQNQVSGNQDVTGIVTGNGKDVVMKEIPIETIVEVGQVVETSGQFGVQPGLYLGRVKEILREEGAPTQTIVIDQGVLFYRATFVEVLL